jgi:regulation of enolase protein 1 (concanavalin A-like superfamily)
MKEIAWSGGTWSRQPISVQEDGRHLVVEAAEGSDWWRTTSYGFIHDDGHGLLADFPDESAVEVSFILDYREQFDQCGIFIVSDTEHWVKAGVEFCDGSPQLGAVVTAVKSDWSVAPVPTWFGKEVTVRASRNGDAITLRAKCDGDFQLLRVLPINPDMKWQAGPMVCGPTRAGLTVRFTSWATDTADSALH